MAKVRRTWKSLGFKPLGNGILVMDPAMAYHDEAAPSGRRIASTRVPTVPDRRLPAQPDTWPDRLSSTARHQVSGHDRVSGTYKVTEREESR
jgi:hypothetical protein